MRKKDEERQSLDELYAQFKPIVDGYVDHRCDGETRLTKCFWCWYYEYALEKIVELEDRIARSAER